MTPESSSWVYQVTYSRTMHDLGDTDGALEGLGVAQLMVNRSSIFISQSRLDVEIHWILPGFDTVILILEKHPFIQSLFDRTEFTKLLAHGRLAVLLK